MSGSFAKRVLLIAMLCSAGNSAWADAPDESDNLRAIARELGSLRSLVHSSAQLSARHEQRLVFNYTYVLEALDYLTDSAVIHVRIRSKQPTDQWDLNQRAKLQRPRSVVVVAPPVNKIAKGSGEQERLSDVAREMELVRGVVKRASMSAGQQRSRLSFDYGYMLDVLSYLDYAVRAHLSLQNSQPRTQWDKNRRIRLNPAARVVIR